MSFNAATNDKNIEKATVFIDWLLTPKDLRQPPTIQDLARDLGVSKQTLYNWRYEPGFQRDMSARARAVIKIEQLPDVIQALYGTALGGGPQSVAASKLLIDFAERQVATRGLDVSKLTSGELRELALAALRELQEEVPVANG